MKRLTSIIILFLTAIIASAASHNAPFYLQRLKDPGLDLLKKLEYTDSLLAHDNVLKDSLIKLKAMLQYETGNFRGCIETYENNIKDIPNPDISEDCKLRFCYLVSLKNRKLYSPTMQECANLLNIPKPDSLIYYNAMVYCLMNGFSRQTKVPLREDYGKLSEDLLNYALEKKLQPNVINKIKKELYSIKMADALHAKNYTDAIEDADILLEIPLSGKEKETLYTNIGYVYMLIGQHEAAEKYFTNVLESGKSQYNKGITLLNYTHMLNLQGKYEETMKLFGQYGHAADGLNKDIYYSHLLGNRAVAESHTIGYEKAFHTLLENKNFEDSLYFNDGVQDSLLLFDYSAKSKEAETLKADSSHKSTVIWILVAIITILALFSIINAAKLRNYKSANAQLISHEEESAKKCLALEHELAERAERESGRIATHMLQFAAIEETLNNISDIISSKSKSDNDKINLISNAIYTMKIEGETREIFRNQFELAHSRFFKNLYAAHSDLTPGEARMCAYLIMNLSTKEIASITNKSTRSVESTRYRVGKKLNAPDGKSLLSYIREFL